MSERLIDALLAELTAKPTDSVVAYRGNHRWVQTWEPVRLEKSGAARSRLREGGSYLITGGLGGIGLTLAEHLAKTVRAKLILTGRSAFPGKDQWEQWLSTHDEQDPISAKIRRLQSFEDQGAEVLVFSADVASQEEMQEVVAHATGRFGRIHGVIHCAGVPDYAGVIDRRSREMTESVLASKVRGTLVLHNILRGAELDFFVLCSSLSSILYHGKFGQVGYCAANDFLDAVACCQSLKEKTFSVSIGWCDWQEVGMSVEARKRWARTRGIADTILDGALSLSEGLSPSEGIEVFSRILENKFPQIVVSPQDLMARIREDEASSQPAFLRSFEKVTKSKTGHERPELRDAYVSPGNEIEQLVAELWKDLLGFDSIGICDNFFDLGGHSLLATQVLSRLRERFQIDLSLHTFFEKPTVQELAQTIAERQAMSGEGENLSRIVSELEALSDEEAKQLLRGTAVGR